MTARDIRIGNLVTDQWYNDFKMIIEVKSINKDGINLEIEDDGNYTECAERYIAASYKFDNIRAIPISEELLLKIGAIKLDSREYSSFNINGMQINFINGKWIEYVSRIEIRGLHHLQNIFYFRTGNELDISALI